jgi:hypothetical protein
MTYILKYLATCNFRIAEGRCLKTTYFAAFRMVALLTRIMFGGFARQCRLLGRKRQIFCSPG